jgi:hypothetical protein
MQEIKKFDWPNNFSIWFGKKTEAATIIKSLTRYEFSMMIRVLFKNIFQLKMY